MFVVMELLYGKEGKEKTMTEHQPYYKTIPVKVEDANLCIESCWKIEGGRFLLNQSTHSRNTL
jgi:hypothetical protein